MTDRNNLKPGSFYWAMPVLDPDTDNEWENDEQPARFHGYDKDGKRLWHWLAVEGDGPDGSSDWPDRWVGDEIVFNERS